MATLNRTAHVALLDSDELLPADAAQVLSPQEFQEYSRIRHKRRRAEWLAGRIAAKFLFLQQEGSGAPVPGGTGPHKIARGDLALYSSELFRQVAVASDQSPGGGAPRIGWRNGAEQVNAALSHANGWACASIGDPDLYSVDLEVPAPRIPPFYLRNFTVRERSWIDACVRSFQLDSDWLYTLLWSAKECLLKTPLFRPWSLWNMSTIEIHIVAGSERLKTVQSNSTLSRHWEYLEFGTSSGIGLPLQFQLAVGGTANLILTAMTKSACEWKGVI